MRPYEAIRDQTVAYGTIWYHTIPTGPYGTIRDHRRPYGSIGSITVPNGNIQDHVESKGTMWDHVGPYRTIAGSRVFQAFSAVSNFFVTY